jgi:type IX secretion system PorP/SprF family membrane protein
MKTIFLILFLVVCCSVFSQDPTFTQFYSNPVYLNPAFTGSNGCPRFVSNYRSQWNGLTGNYQTTSFAYDQYFKSLSGGIGIIGLYDSQGQNTIQTSMLGLTYSYHLKVNRKFSVMFGARAAYFQKFLDWNKLTFGDMIDPRRGFIYQTNEAPRGGSRGFLDISSGVIGFSKNYFFGIAMHHMNRPDESLILGKSNLPIRYTAHLGSNIRIDRNGRYGSSTILMPNIIYQYQNGFQEFNIGAYVKYGDITAGVWYRTTDAFILSFGYQTSKYKVGYSYDLTTSRLGNMLSQGSHEVSLGFNLKCGRKPKAFRTISCPSF